MCTSIGILARKLNECIESGGDPKDLSNESQRFGAQDASLNLYHILHVGSVSKALILIFHWSFIVLLSIFLEARARY